MSRRNTVHGSGTATSALNSHSPARRRRRRSGRSTRLRTAPSSLPTSRGANSGSSSRRNFTCSGGSICSGISGRMLPMSIDPLDEKTSGSRSAAITSSWRVMSVMSMSGAATTPMSRIIGWNCCGFAAVDWSTSSQPIAGRPFASLMSDPPSFARAVAGSVRPAVLRCRRTRPGRYLPAVRGEGDRCDTGAGRRSWRWSACSRRSRAWEPSRSPRTSPAPPYPLSPRPRTSTSRTAASSLCTAPTCRRTPRYEPVRVSAAIDVPGRGARPPTDSGGGLDLAVPARRKIVELITVNENGAVLARADCIQAGMQCTDRADDEHVPRRRHSPACPSRSTRRRRSRRRPPWWSRRRRTWPPAPSSASAGRATSRTTS